MTTSRSSLPFQALIALVLACVAGSSSRACRAQDIMLPGDFTPRVKKHKTPDKLPPIPTMAPSFTIPAAPLGYGTPGITYLGRNQTLITLIFLDEDHLLFSFRATGLMERDTDEAHSSAPRQMRGVVLKLPEGKVEHETTWTLPDRKPFLWTLGDSRFLLRDRDGLQIGDATLKTKLVSALPGQFLGASLDPAGKFLLASAIDPQAHFDSTNGLGTRKALSLKTADGQSAEVKDVADRLVQLDSGQVLSTRHGTSVSPASINSEGTLETTHDKLDQWNLGIRSFNGGSANFARVESTCLPKSQFASQNEVLVAGCTEGHVPKLSAISSGGQVLWQAETPIAVVPPHFAFSRDGSRFARETIVFKHPPSPDTETLWVKVVKGQVVRVFDASNGKVVLETPVSPVLDAGGNMALSPSGRRLAVLHEGAIELFDLPASTPTPNSNAK